LVKLSQNIIVLLMFDFDFLFFYLILFIIEIFFFFDSSNILQSEDRCYRIGQKRNVFVYPIFVFLFIRKGLPKAKPSFQVVVLTFSAPAKTGHALFDEHRFLPS